MEEYQERIRLAKITLSGSVDTEAREAACADLRAVIREADGTAAAREALEVLELCHASLYPSYSDPEVRKLRQEWSAIMGLTDSRLPDILEKLKANTALATCMYQDVLSQMHGWIREALDKKSAVLQPKNLPAMRKVIEIISGIEVYNIMLEEMKPFKEAVFRLDYQETSRLIEESLSQWEINEAWKLWDALGTPTKGLEAEVKELQQKIYDASAVCVKVETLLGRTPVEPLASWPAAGEMVSHTQELFTHGHEYLIPEPWREKLDAALESGLASIAQFVEAEAARALSFSHVREFWEEFERLPRIELHRRIEPQPSWFHTFLETLEETARRESASAPNFEALEKYATYLKGQRVGLPDFIVTQVDYLLGRIAKVAATWRAMSRGEEFVNPDELPLPSPTNMQSGAPVYRALLDSLRKASAQLSSGAPASEEFYLDILRVAEGVLKEMPGHALAIELKGEVERGLTAYRVERAVANWDINGLLRLAGANPGNRACDYYTRNGETLRTWFADVATRPPVEDHYKAAIGWTNWQSGVSQLSPGMPGALVQAIVREEERRRSEWYALLSILLKRVLSHHECLDIAKSLEEHSEDPTLAALRQSFLRKADVAKAYEYIEMKRWDEAREIIDNLDRAHPDAPRLNTLYMVDRAKSRGVEELSLVLKNEWNNVSSCLDKPLKLLLEAIEEAWEQGLSGALEHLHGVVRRALGNEELAETGVAARLSKWGAWFDIEQAVRDGESTTSLKRLIAYLRENREAEPSREQLKNLVMHWDTTNNLVMLAWAESMFGAVGLDYDPLERLKDESKKAAEGVSKTLRTKADLTPTKLEEMLSEVGELEANWKRLKDYLKLTGAPSLHPLPPERFRTAVEQTRGLKQVMNDLDALVHADLREPALQDRLETVVASLRGLVNVAVRVRLLTQAEHLQTLTNLDDLEKHIRESARRCRSENYLFDSDVFSTLGQNVRVLAQRFKDADALGGYMWDAVSKDCCDEVYHLACIYEACPEPQDLETLATRLDELNRADKDFIRAVNELRRKMPFVSADRSFDPEHYTGYLTRFPDTVPPFLRAYLYFERRLASVGTLRDVIEQSRHKLPEWVGRYLDEGIPPCAGDP